MGDKTIVADVERQAKAGKSMPNDEDLNNR